MLTAMPGDRTPAAFPRFGTARCLFRHMPSDPLRVERPGRVLTAPPRATGLGGGFPGAARRDRLRVHGIRPLADRVWVAAPEPTWGGSI